jgi:hypothetical protein
VLSRHPERVYDWIAEAIIIVPEVLLVPLYLGGKGPLGTLWIVSDREGHFDRCGTHRRDQKRPAEAPDHPGDRLRRAPAEH